MSVPTPAWISYEDDNGNLQELRFHAVISEGHEAQTQITKFPVQTGFSVSNHAIRQNRKVVIEGIISNTPIAGTKTAYVYGSDNQVIVFNALEALVNSATVCEVVTNLGLYDPVVFNRFTTKQAAGSVDSMQFTLYGEEVQVKSTINKTAPKAINFSKVPDVDYQATLDSLTRAGFEAKEGVYLETGECELGTDFTIATKDNKGADTTTTYINKGYDPVKGTYKYEVHVEAEEVAEEVESGVSLFSIAGVAASSTSTCLAEDGFALAVDAVEGVTNTVFGTLRNSFYGHVQNLTNLGGSTAGNALLGMGADCVVAGAMDGFDAFADEVVPNTAVASSVGLPGTQAVVDQLTVYGAEGLDIPRRTLQLTKMRAWGGNLL